MKYTRILKQRLNLLSGRFNRFKSHSLPILKRVTVAMNIMTFIASLVALVSLVLLVGFDNSPHYVMALRHTVRVCHVFFIFAVLYSIVLNFRQLLSQTRPFGWFVDGMMLVTLLPLLYPHPLHPWLPWLEHILYSNYFNAGVIGVYAGVMLCSGIVNILGRHTNPSVILGFSFLFFIMIGSFLLMMPKCVNVPISYVDSLFVSTSAVCITGLTPVDVSIVFTPLGLLVLALLVQIGGLGVLTFTSLFAMFFSGNSSIYSQLMVRDMVYTRTMNNLLPTLLYILFFTLTIEAIGTVLIFLCIHNTLNMPLNDELIFAGFHSLTAFMNAGFSNIEGGLSNPALLYSNQSIYIVASVLILAGGIGFPILVNMKSVVGSYLRRMWDFLRGHARRHYPTHLYDVNTKVVLWSTLIIFVASSLLFFVFEQNHSLKGMSLYEKIVQSVFNSFVPRSSGFASVPPTHFLNITLIMMVVLMWIGGASQSTAGGVKINTVAAVYFNLKSIITGRKEVTAFNRRISIYSIRRANAVIILSIATFVLYAMLLVGFEPQLPVKDLLYETASAIFTVGSSLGVTDKLSDISKIVLCTAMFIGRVGLLSLLMGISYNARTVQPKYPSGDIIIN